MANKKLHPSVQQFKEFVKDNPKIVQEVRKGNATWQELFEDWYLLGEEDSRWEDFRKEKGDSKSASKKNSNKDWMTQILHTIKKMDSNQLQEHISSLSQALGAIQGVISQFQGGSPSNQAQNTQQNQAQPQHPFQFRKD